MENKYYYLNFTLDHLIKLDRYFLDASVTFINEKGETFILNKNNKTIILKGDKFKVISNKKALLYFYHRIPNYSKKGTVIFDKSQKGKNMKINIKSRSNLIIKDFCFEGYYPILSNQTWQKSYGYVINIDNALDNLEYDLFEGENYIIYIFDAYDENDFPISDSVVIMNIQYVDNLLSIRNKYNFEVIPGKTNGSIILNSLNKPGIKYEFFTCKNQEIKLKLQSYSLSNYEQTYKNETAYFTLNKDDTLINTFESEYDFLFIYRFYNNKEFDSNNIKDYKSTIVSLDEISRNIIRIKFNADSNLRKYHIVIAKKDEYNNNRTFSDPCHVAKLMTKNSNLIVVKTIYESTYNPVIITDINISSLNIAENEELVIVIINQILSIQKTNFSTPSEYKLILKEAKETTALEYYQLNMDEINYFKFDYIHESDIDQVAVFKSSYRSLFIFNEINQTEYTVFDFYNDEFTITLNKSGTFYFDFYLKNQNKGSFYYYITGKKIATIDLSERLYSKKNKLFEFRSKYNPEKYIVNNLKKNTYVFFIFSVGELHKYDNPFVICNYKNECEENIITYNF